MSLHNLVIIKGGALRANGVLPFMVVRYGG